MRLIVLPFAFVTGAIGPSLLAETVAETTKPLATIHGSILKGIFAFLTLLLLLNLLTILNSVLILALLIAFKMVLQVIIGTAFHFGFLGCFDRILMVNI